MALPEPELFRSFWMGGYECATQINHAGLRLDMIAGVQHDEQVNHDYALLKTVGMRAARDGVRWHLIDRGSAYDFSSFAPMFKAAHEQGIQVIWDLCHYGWPDDIDIFSSAFVDRFARFSRAMAQYIRDATDEIPFYAPVNEISFFSWGAARGLIFPYAEGRDHEIKQQLIRATIASCEALREVDSRARFIYPEPTINVVAPKTRPGLKRSAAQYTRSQFEAWDMIAGISHPELGGRPEYLDILGSNFYASNQWQVSNGHKLQWDEIPRDSRWKPYHQLLKDIWERYRRPLFVAETSHVGVGRAQWIGEITDEVYLARMNGVPVEGVCLYPILDRYDWGDFHHWHNSGLWDLQLNQQGHFERVLNEIYASELRRCQEKMASIGCR